MSGIGWIVVGDYIVPVDANTNSGIVWGRGDGNLRRVACGCVLPDRSLRIVRSVKIWSEIRDQNLL